MLDGSVLNYYNGSVLDYHKHKSRNFDFHKVCDKPQKRYIPPMSHPWKQGAFSAFVKKERHKYKYSFEEVINSQAVSF